MSLTPAFENQDRVFSAAFAVLEAGIGERAFPGASIAVMHQGRLIALKAFGQFVYQTDMVAPSVGGAPLLAGVAGSGSGDIIPATLFDLASVTKVVATTTMAMILYERGLLDLDAPVAGSIPEFRSGSDPRRDRVTFRMLLAHSSGLPAYEKLFLKARSRTDLLSAASATPLAADPGTQAEYSDVGFIILGAALERIAEEPLDRFCQREIFGRLGMSHTTFNPPAEMRPQIPPTADERKEAHAATSALGRPAEQSSAAPRSEFRNRIIQGEVQDENASVLGGVAGHAGLFASAEDLARFAQAMLECGAGTPAGETIPVHQRPSASQILRAETVSLFTRRESLPAGTSRALGWDTPSSPSQSGKYFGPRSYGHLGYTGTSLWIDPERQLSITLLTSRTWPDCSNEAIKQVRPCVHDAIVEAIL
jgi:serine-type D-Ala-D-Ala carboxypeptidase